MRRRAQSGEHTNQDLEAEIATIRGALDRSVEMYGLRSTAREVAMSPTGLRGLIDGREAYSQTFRKLRAWHAVWQARHGRLDDADEVALRVLLEAVPTDRRANASARLRELLTDLRSGDQRSSPQIRLRVCADASLSSG